MKDLHPAFENRDYILHFKEDDEQQKEVRKKFKEKKWIC
jgi:hypothetical protein